MKTPIFLFLLLFLKITFLDAQQDSAKIMSIDNSSENLSNYEQRIPDPNEIVIVDREVQILNMDSMRIWIGYPAEAKEKVISGKVVVRILINKKGEYVKHIVLKDPHPILTNQVTSQLPKIKCLPALQANKPISCWMTIPFAFKLGANKD